MAYRATATAVAAPKKKKDREAELHYITWQAEQPKTPIFPIDFQANQ